jgi:hypothetical protein
MTITLSREVGKKPSLPDIVLGFKANSLDIRESHTHTTPSLFLSFFFFHFVSISLVYMGIFHPDAGMPYIPLHPIAGILGKAVRGTIICLWPMANPSVV